MWRVHGGKSGGAQSRTDGDDDENDEEGVGERQDGPRERVEDLGDGRELAEDAQHSTAAEEEDETER